MVRDAVKGNRLELAGAELCIANLEGDIDSAFAGIDAVVFTAGSGSETGKDKTLMVDLWGAVKSIGAAEAAGVSQFIMVSALKAKDPERAAASLRPYLVAKAAADAILEHSSLHYTILRPGRLHDEATEGYEIAENLKRFDGATSRINVATLIRQLLRQSDSPSATVEILDKA